MAARGPDAQGKWWSADGRVGLAHRRLAIIDLSTAGNQPMVEPQSGCVVVFNGEIYNYRELAEELHQAGVVFRSQSDTEVLLQGYLHWGESLLMRLRGMFAFALWDPRVNGLWLVRDPYGIKPLYYGERAGRFFFASQVRPLLAHAGLDDAPDPAGVVGFMLTGSVPEPHTCYRGIRSLRAGHSVWVKANGVASERSHASVTEVWRRAAEQPEVVAPVELQARVRTAVMASVRAHRVADVPVGAFLSAGIDSGALVGLMAEVGDERIETVTLGFESFRGGPRDETVQAAAIAAHYGVGHRVVWVDDAEAAADLGQVLEDMDQPSVDGFNTWLVSKHTAAAGLKVVISGIGGDELFGGYATFADLPRWQARLRSIGRVPGATAVLRWCAQGASRLGLTHAKAEAVARYGTSLAGLYFCRRGLFMPWQLEELLEPGLLATGLAALAIPEFLAEGDGPLPAGDYATIATLEATTYMRNQLLRDSDWASMAHSLELRTPLVDFELLRELAPLLLARPAGNAGKRPLAESPQPPLPADVIVRRKSGFSLPLDRWVRKSPELSAWRDQASLRPERTPWARRMAYALIAQRHPDWLRHEGGAT